MLLSLRIWLSAFLGQTLFRPFHYNSCPSSSVKLIVDTDLFSDVDDTTAILLAATQPCVELLGVQLNWPSSYSIVAASSILTHYSLSNVPIGTSRPINNSTFFDSWFFRHGEYASKVQHNWPHRLSKAEDACDAAELYRKLLARQEDGSVTIASIGFLDNLSALLNTTGDKYSPLSGPALVQTKVSHLVVMGGDYPSGSEFNFVGSTPNYTAHVINNWPGNMTFIGLSLGQNIMSGSLLTTDGPKDDPVVAAYQWYNGYNNSQYSWDPIAVFYAIGGGHEHFAVGNGDALGYNRVLPNGSNYWVNDGQDHGQRWLRIADGTTNETIASLLDNAYLAGVRPKKSGT